MKAEDLKLEQLYLYQNQGTQFVVKYTGLHTIPRQWLTHSEIGTTTIQLGETKVHRFYLLKVLYDKDTIGDYTPRVYPQNIDLSDLDKIASLSEILHSWTQLN